MSKVTINNGSVLGKIKPMHAVNNGPVMPSRMFSMGGNFDDFKAAKIPFVRNHDASLCSSYGGERTVDINAIFPDFGADPYSPDSYDFACTDYYTETILRAGAEVFYRLGNKIDHRVKKYDSLPPEDNEKWAVVCEHVIMHYNEGWADGFHYGIKYWEIWNEPDNCPECWCAPFEDFLPFFATTAKHLKARFPHLKIGGPAFATGGVDRADRLPIFLDYMEKNRVPMDFLSWHLYRCEVAEYEKRAVKVRKMLDGHGFADCESIVNEWNYVINWHESLNESKRAIIGMKGAAFSSAIMSAAQKLPVDMMMYYDARPCALNGLFYFYDYSRLKGYYPFPMFARLYALGNETASESDDGDVYVVSATNGEKCAAMLTYFTNEKAAESKKVELCLVGEVGAYSVALLDEDHDVTIVSTAELKNGRIFLEMSPNSTVLLEKQS